jgi:hypothetical protein
MNYPKKNLKPAKMKFKPVKPLMIILTLLIFSCDEPETTVTDIVHKNGSVTRKIEMKGDPSKFKESDQKVPYDSTWVIKDSLIIESKKDTILFRKAEKLFKNAGEINLSYRNDRGANKGMKRVASFNKKFRWFNTDYRFSEMLEKRMSAGYPISDFLSREELNYYFSPDNVKSEKQNGPDSLKFRRMEDTLSKKSDKWMQKSLVSQWIHDFSGLVKSKAPGELSEAELKKREEEFYNILMKYEKKFDSIWATGVVLKEMIGDANALRFKSEADTALKMIERIITSDFRDYSVKIMMPGKLIGTNGYIDSCEVLLWPVKQDFFLTENYEMWAESKTTNRWAWVITGLFILFVFTGMIIRLIRRRKN